MSLLDKETLKEVRRKMSPRFKETLDEIRSSIRELVLCCINELNKHSNLKNHDWVSRPGMVFVLSKDLHKAIVDALQESYFVVSESIWKHLLKEVESVKQKNNYVS